MSGKSSGSCYLECVQIWQKLGVSDAVEVAHCRARNYFHRNIMIRPALVLKKCVSYDMGQLNQGAKTRLLT